MTRKKSDAELRLSGTHRPYRHKPAPPADGAVPDPPAWMDGPALEYWHELVPLLAGTATRLDAGVVSLHCQSFGTWVKACAILERDGLTTEGPGGREVPHPVLKTRDAAAGILLKTAEALNITPRARGARPNPPTSRKPSPIDDILNGRGSA